MEIKIPEVPLVSIESYSTDSEEVVWFTIQIKLKDREWTVNHRFNYGSRSLQLIRLVPTRWHTRVDPVTPPYGIPDKLMRHGLFEASIGP